MSGREWVLDHPAWLLWLWLLLPLAWLFLRAERRRRADALSFAAAPMAARLVPERSRARPWLRAATWCAGLFALGVAAAGPRFGVTYESVTQRGADLMIALDVSRSMLSQDVAPDRLGRAKSDVRDLVERVAGHRLGLLAFAGKARLLCPLTTDRGFFLSALERADPESAPRGGTALGDAIRAALQFMPPERDRDQALVLITDGEDHDSYPLEAAQAAAERGVKIFAVGLGDPEEGARVPVRAGDGSLAFLEHDGQQVWSKMQEGLLADLATRTGGAYVPARTCAYDLGAVYEEHLAGLAAGTLRTDERRRLAPRFQVFLALGLLLLALERWLAAPAARPQARAGARIAALALAAAFGGPLATADAAEKDAAEEVRAGIRLLEAGKPDEALARFEAAAAARPDDARILFDRGCARQAAGDLDGAHADYLAVAAGRERDLAPKAQFNLGSVAAKRAELALGEFPEEAAPEARAQAIDHVEAAIRRFRSCLALDPEHEGARRNVETLRLWVKHMADVWARKDREKAREDKDLLQFLDWLHELQGGVRGGARALSTEPDSPLRRTAVDALARRQRDLVEEVPHLDRKIAETLEAAAAGADPAAGAVAVDPALLERQMQELAKVTAEMRRRMGSAADALDAARFSEADAAGKEVQQALDALGSVFASFEGDARRAAKLAGEAVEATPPSAEPEPVLRARELAERVEMRATVLAPKAQAALEQLGSEPGVAMRPALERAVENGPLAAQHAAAAREAVAQDDGEGARRECEAAKRLLDEIVELLPKPDPQGEPEAQDRPDPGETGESPPEPQEGEPPESQDPQDGEGEEGGEAGPKPPAMTPEQAEALLRKAVENARRKAEESERAEAAVIAPGKVDRDW